MANEYKIELSKRDKITRQNLKQLRKEGNIPGIYYSSSSKDSVPIYITKNDLNLAIKSGARIFNIAVGDKKQNVLFKSVQYHPVTDEILHIDLYGIRMDQAITIKVAIDLQGDAIGVKDEGGILNQPLNELEIQCLPSDIPDSIELDISELGMGDSLNAGDIVLDEKFKLVTNEDSVIISVTQPMKEVEPIVEADDAEEFMDEYGVEDGEAEDKADDKHGEDNKNDGSSPDKESESK